MDSFPGGFPGVHDSNSASSHSNTFRNDFSSTSIAEANNIQRSLKMRRKAFKKDFVFRLDCFAYVYIIISYLYDCSLLLLLLRSFMQSSILLVQSAPVLEIILTKEMTKKSARPIFYGLILSNVLSVIVHYTRDLPSPNDDGFVYGHQTLQVIGQTQLSNKNWLYLIDTAIFLSQLTLFTSQYFQEQDRTTRAPVELASEYDGWQGTTISLKLPIIKALHPPLITIEELKVEEEEMERRQTEALVHQEDQPDYGSLNRNEVSGNETGLEGYSF